MSLPVAPTWSPRLQAEKGTQTFRKDLKPRDRNTYGSAVPKPKSSTFALILTSELPPGVACHRIHARAIMTSQLPVHANFYHAKGPGLGLRASVSVEASKA